MSQLSEGRWPGELSPKDERLALVTFATGAEVQHGDEVHYLDVAAGDLSVLNSGRAPFLKEHRYWIEDLLGSVQTAWIEDDKALAIVRFADTIAANQIWDLIRQGFPIGASLGYRIGTTRSVDLGTERSNGFIVDTWQATEISACIEGADPGAHVRHRPFAELAALRDERMARRLERERADKIAALKGERWRHWAANGAASFIAATADVPEDRIASPLVAAVEAHLAKLEAEL
jgi:hypothetical protein